VTSSHPPTLLRLVERCLKDDCQLAPGARLVVAVSGGPDSMALLHALHLQSKNFGFELLAACVDHGLRPEAADEVRLVERCCGAWGVEFRALELGLVGGANLQERAREARYEALWALAREHFGSEVFLATAHQKDDRAETVLLRLLRGTSLAGLGVLAPRDGALLRPAIHADRHAVLAHLERHAVPFATDPSNRDPHYLRVRVRHELLPLLRELSPGIVEQLVDLSEEATRGDAALGLNREQRQQLRRALLEPGRAIDLPLPAGLRLRRE